MPIKKGKKRSNSQTKSKKQIKQKQKQRQSQVQKVVVNIHKSASKRSTVPKSTATSKSIMSSMPIYQAEPIAYPSYRRQAQAIPIELEVPTAVPVATPVPTKKRRAEVPLFSEPPETVKRIPVNMFPKSTYAFPEFPEFQKPEPNLEFSKIYRREEPKIKIESRIKQEPIEPTIYQKPEEFMTENPLAKTKRSYVRKNPEIPRRNSNEDLLNRYEAATGGSYEGPTLKVGAFKAIVEELEQQ